MRCSTQRLNDLGDESRLLPLWRQVIYCLRLVNCYRRILLLECGSQNLKITLLKFVLITTLMSLNVYMQTMSTLVIQSDFLFCFLIFYFLAYVTNASTQAEPRFLWNNYLLEVLIENKVGLF